MKKGPSASEKKSFMHVLRKLAVATIHHSCQSLIVSVMILVVSDGPKRMKSVVKRPIDLNANSTIISQQMRTAMDMRLSSNMVSKNEFDICCLSGGCMLCSVGLIKHQWGLFTGNSLHDCCVGGSGYAGWLRLFLCG